jgi:hypothetical protein
MPCAFAYAAARARRAGWYSAGAALAELLSVGTGSELDGGTVTGRDAWFACVVLGEATAVA